LKAKKNDRVKRQTGKVRQKKGGRTLETALPVEAMVFSLTPENLRIWAGVGREQKKKKKSQGLVWGSTTRASLRDFQKEDSNHGKVEGTRKKLL